MKYKIIFASFFVLAAILLAIAIKPETNEMVYVYEKSENLEKANNEYQKILKKSPNDLKSERKLVDNLYKTRDKKYIIASIEYYKKDKDYKIIRRIIDGFKANNDFERSLKWLKIAYKDFNKIEDLQEFLKIASFISNEKSQIFALKKLYELTNDKELLFTLYGINQKEFALNKLHKLEKNNLLTNDETIKLIKFFIYERDLNTAYELYKNHNLSSLKVYENESDYKFLILQRGTYEDITNFYSYLYYNSNEKKYYEQYKNFLITEGEIEKYIELNKEIFSKSRNKEALEQIIQYSYLNGDLEEYLEFLSKKAIDEKDISTANSIIAYYIDLGEEESLFKFLERLNNINNKFDEFKKLVLQTYAFIGFNEEAEKILLNFPPKEVSADVVYSVFERKINEKSMPYFMEVLKESKDKFTKSKLFRYRYKTLKLFTDETYKYFGKPTTLKKLLNYIGEFEKEDINKYLIKYAQNSNDPQFLAELAQLLMFNQKIDEAKKFYKKALTIYSKNRLALKNLGFLYLTENKTNEALELFNSLKKISKDDYQVDYYLGEIYVLQEQKAKAKVHYEQVIKNLKPSSLENRYMILKAKSILTTPTKYNAEFKKLYENSEQNINTLADIWSIYLQKEEYSHLLKEFDNKSELIKANNRLKEIEINTYLSMKKLNLAKTKLKEFSKEAKSKDDLADIYEKLGFIEYQDFNKKEALDSYEKSISYKKNKELEEFVQNLRKDFRNRIDLSIGIRNEIEQFSIGYRHTFEKVKVEVRQEKFDEFNSSKLLVSDLNDKYQIGFGKDYLSFKANNFLNTKVSLFFEKFLDSNSVLTIEDELKYKSFGFEFNHNFNDKVYYNLKYTNFDYDKYSFERKRFENSFYIPFKDTYFSSIAFVNEKVDKINNFGYEDLNNTTIAFGKTDNITKYLSYYLALGVEFKESNESLLSNFNLNYSRKDDDIILENSFSKDNLTNDYNFSNIIYYKHYF